MVNNLSQYGENILLRAAGKAWQTEQLNKWKSKHIREGNLKQYLTRMDKLNEEQVKKRHGVEKYQNHIVYAI